MASACDSSSSQEKQTTVDVDIKKAASAAARLGLNKAIYQDAYYSGRGCWILLELDEEVLVELLPAYHAASTSSTTPLREASRADKEHDREENSEHESQPNEEATAKERGEATCDNFPEFDSFFAEEGQEIKYNDAASCDKLKELVAANRAKASECKRRKAEQAATATCGKPAPASEKLS